MASEREIAANRKNALMSTGPRTKRGKAIVGKNALRHGLTAQEILVPGESEDEFEGLVQRLIAEFQPEGEFEQQLVERIAACLWRQRRIYRIESEILRREYLEAEISRLRDMAKFYTVDGLKSPVFRPEFVSKNQKKLYDRALDERLKRCIELTYSKLSLGQAFMKGHIRDDTLIKLARYESGIERALYKAHHELLRLQARRRGEDGTVPRAIDVQIDTND